MTISPSDGEFPDLRQKKILLVIQLRWDQQNNVEIFGIEFMQERLVLNTDAACPPNDAPVVSTQENPRKKRHEF